MPTSLEMERMRQSLAVETFPGIEDETAHGFFLKVKGRVLEDEFP